MEKYSLSLLLTIIVITSTAEGITDVIPKKTQTFWETRPIDPERSYGMCFFSDSLFYEYFYDFATDSLRYIPRYCTTFDVTKQTYSIKGDTLFIISWWRPNEFSKKESVYDIDAYIIINLSNDEMSLVKLVKSSNEWRQDFIPYIIRLQRCKECTEPRGNLWLL